MTIETYEVSTGVQKFDTCVKGSPTCPERDNYNAYANLKADSKTIDTRVMNLKKIWYKSANKEDQYKKEVEHQAKAKAREKTKEWKLEFDQLYSSIDSYLKKIKSMEEYCPQTEYMAQKLKSITNEQTKEKKNIIKQADLDNRLTSFYNNNDYYEDLLYYIKWLYWVMVLFCVVMLFMSGQFRNVRTYIFFIILFIFPTVILQPVITWANTNISHVKLNTLYLIFLIMGGLIISMLYYSGNYAMPIEKIQQPQ